jgi:hypothetical protein
MLDTIYNNINYLFTDTYAVDTDAVDTYAVDTDAVDTDAVDTDAVDTDAVNTNKWTCSKMSDQLRYTNSFMPLDEFVIVTNDTDINVTIPLDSVSYKTTFYNLNDAINYVKMHLECYKAS